MLDKMELSVAHSQPTTLTTNHSELNHSEPSGLSEHRIQSDTDSQQELGQEIVADPALRSRQCGSSALGTCVPWTWAKNGNLVAPSSDRIWADLFDTVDSWEKYSQNHASQMDLRPLLRIYYVQKEWTLVFSNNSFTITRDWEIIAEAWKVLGIPPLPTKPHGLEKQYSVQLIEDFIWENLELSLNLLMNYAYDNRGFAKYVMHICFDHLARTYKLELLSFVFGVQEYLSWVHHDIIPNHTPKSPEVSAAADAESAAAMKQWKVDRLQVEEHMVHVEIPLIHVLHPDPWHIRPHEGYPGKCSRDDEEHSLSYIASHMFGANDMCETHVAILHDLLGPGPWPSAQTYVVLGFCWVYEYGERIKVYDNEEDDPMFSTPKPAASSEFDDTYDGHDEDDDYWREPSPLDPCQENATKALISAAENGDDSAWQRIELALRGAHGKKRGKSCNEKPTQSDFETALMRLWRSSTKEERQRDNDARCCAKQAQCAKDYVEADQSRNELEAIEKLKAEELRQEAETHVHEVEQHEHEASQSHQSAPTVSSVPPPPPPPTPAPHHPPATSGSAQHALLPLPLALPRYLLNPLHLLLDFLIANEIGTEPPNRPDHQGGCLSPFDVQLEGNPLCLHRDIFGQGHHHVKDTLGPHNNTPGHGLHQDDNTPDLHEDNPCHQELMGHNHCKSRLTPLVAGPSSSAMKPGNNVSWPPPECLRMAHWPALDIEGIDCTEEPMDWVQRYSEHGVLAARRLRPNRRKGAQYHMYLLFKDMAKRDSCLQILAGSLVNNQVESFQYKNDLVNCLGVTEVQYMQEAYINAHSMAEVKELLAVGPIPYLIPLNAINEMLDYKQFPALIDPCPGPQQSHPMTSVEFDMEWLSR
ncbi:hypothetical protein BS47DRAFT_1364787 [Hydnum rufescens UP504]|uniref:Uncharacterized protein n=1 Tax=Hydnum rufescens UP504 TaxID=1448309 RepID=A0A9P6AR06_9AGAM|nr:hypothetical protein BS47DRAFT_1364787 [Hydnum rufescens UP504]